MDFQKRVKVAPDVLFRTLSSEAILLNLKTERYYELDDVGVRMWQCVNESETIQAAYETLIEEYAVEPSQLKQDMTDLLTQLLENQLIVLQDA